MMSHFNEKHKEIKNLGAIFSLFCGAMYFSSLCCLNERKKICGESISITVYPPVTVLATTPDAGGDLCCIHFFIFIFLF